MTGFWICLGLVMLGLALDHGLVCIANAITKTARVMAEAHNERMAAGK